MLPELVLKSTATSPFGRKVKIAAHILGLADRIRIETTDPWQEGGALRALNPLGKMPVLVLPDGTAIYDSHVIVAYLDTLAGSQLLLPADPMARVAALTLEALGDGMIEAALLITYETRRRPAAFTYEPWIAHQRGKIERALDYLAHAPPTATTPTVGAIAIACALGYLDWRKAVDWRARHPSLVSWLDGFRAHVPAFDLTKSEPDH